MKNLSKKLLLFVIVQVILVAFCTTAYAEPLGADDIRCESFVLIDAQTGEVLLEKNMDKQLAPASTTKIMTALLLLESGKDLEDTYTCGSEVTNFPKDATLLGLKKGTTIKFKDLLYGMLITSGNDAASAIAVALGGSIDGFADMMNQRAEQLGLENTHFVNPHGLDRESHYSSAHDLALLSREAMKIPLFKQIVSTSSYDMPANNKMAAKTIYTTNKLISTQSKNAEYHYAYATGIKTGSTGQAKGCLVASAKKDGREFITVILGDDSSKNDVKYVRRWVDAVRLFEYAYELKYINLYDLVQNTRVEALLPGLTGSKRIYPVFETLNINYYCEENLYQALSGAEVLDYQFQPDTNLVDAPKSGQIVGTISYSINGTEVYTCSAKYVDEAAPTPSGGETNGDTHGEFLSREIIIAFLAIALIAAVIILIRFITAPARRRRLRKSGYLHRRRIRRKRRF